MIYNMAMALKLGMMEIIIKVILSLVKKKDRVFRNGLMVHILMDSGQRI